MAQQVVPTKGNLININKSLSLAKVGFDLMDRKRNILIREMMMMIDKANMIRDNIDSTYREAYIALQKANITLGICDDISQTVPVEDGLHISFRSVMGVEIPIVNLDHTDPDMCYGFLNTNSQFDNAYICFHKVKLLTATLAEVENSVYRLANAIKKVQKRANALRNVIIPGFAESRKYIMDVLEEREREEFSRLKVIKANKMAE